MKKLIVFSGILVIGVFGFVQCHSPKSKDQNNSLSSVSGNFGGYATQEELGEHLVAIAGCHDCHTPKKMGPNGPELALEKALSGHPSEEPIPGLNRQELEAHGAAATQGLTSWIGPWGVSFTANITSDPTGIGNWSLDQFKRALREGKSKGIASNRNLLPPMPLMQDLNDVEIEAIFAYLQSTQPISNVVPQPMPPVTH